MNRAVVALPALAVWSCGTPTPQIMLELTTGRAQSCPDDCSKVLLPCKAMMSIRVVDPDAPDDPTRRHLTQCVMIQPDKQNDVCSLNMINLDPTPLPVKDLAVQVAVFPLADTGTDAVTGLPVCPDVDYDASNGFPQSYSVAPVVGGQAFYHPGDQIVKVVLGCTDLSARDAGAACTDPANLLTVSVDDFDTRVPVKAGPDGSDLLHVSSGEPRILDGGYVLSPADLTMLNLGNADTPTWISPGPEMFSNYACVEVIEDAPQTVATLHCSQASDLSGPLGGHLTGMWIRKLRLQALLAAFSLPPDFPTEGLTIGMVLDDQANGLENYTVTTTPPAAGATAGSVAYMPAMMGVPATMTTKSGVFLSRDAPFGTMFSARGQAAMAPAVGGLVAGKVTVVLLSPTSAQQ